MQTTDPVAVATEALDEARERLREAQVALAPYPGWSGRSTALLSDLSSLEADLALGSKIQPIETSRQVRKALPWDDWRSTEEVADIACLSFAAARDALVEMVRDGEARQAMFGGLECWSRG